MSTPAPPMPSNEDGDTATAAVLPPSHSADADDDAHHTEDGDTERQEYMAMQKEEVVAHALSLKQEVSRQNTVVQSLTLQRDWIIDRKPQVIEVLQLIETLSDAKEEDGKRSTRTIGTTAIPSSIDKAWTRKCTASPAAREWWESDLPRPLANTPRPRASPPTNTAATSTDSSPASPPVTPPLLFPRQSLPHHCRRRRHDLRRHGLRHHYHDLLRHLH